MKSIKNIGLYWRTIKYLRPIQIFNRIYRKLFFPKFLSKKTLQRSNFNFPNYELFNSQSDIKSNTFTFLNSKKNLTFPQDWNNKKIPLLWTYNLHYFDDLLASNISFNEKKSHIQRWIKENPYKSRGPAWDPYTLSIRIVNWIKFFSKEQNITDIEISSLLEQIRCLNRTLEYHLLGNHLLENAKALIFSGLFFNDSESSKWLSKGILILDKELKEQILEDGAHFELSPMYHSIMLDLVIDIYDLCISANNLNYEHLFSKKDFFANIILKMHSWLIHMIHPDGEIAYFNDSAIGVSNSPEKIFSRLNKLNLSANDCFKSNAIHLKDSGFYRIHDNDFTLFFDCGDIGPSYLPGHGHADSLSLELSYLDQRIFVNLGTSEYKKGARRDFERGTAAHSTLSVNNENSSEVWDSFRVGKRAKVTNSNLKNQANTISIFGEHNGYDFIEKNLLHQRKIEIDNFKISIIDKLTRGGHSAIVKFHLHPDVDIYFNSTTKSGDLILPNGNKIEWIAECEKIYIEDSEYASEFGILNKTKTLCLSGKNFHESKLIINTELL